MNDEAIISQAETPEVGQSQETAEVRQTIAPEVQTPLGQSEIPEKLRGQPLEKVVESYTNLESKFTQVRQRQIELENRLSSYEQQAAAKGPTEDEIFRQEWEQNPQIATYNQSQRTMQRAQMLNSQTATSMFYQQAKNDKASYPGFTELEPRMMELARDLAPMINPQYLSHPVTIQNLYKIAKGESMEHELANVRAVAVRESEKRRKEVGSAAFESSTPQSSSNIRDEDMTLEQLEKKLGFAQR